MTQETTLEQVGEQTQPNEQQQNGAQAPEADLAAEAVEQSPESLQIAQLQSELAVAQAKVAELTDTLQRTAAEYQNSRRRQERQLAEEIERSGSHLLRRLLPILDDLELAFANAPQTEDEAQRAWVDGLHQIQKKLFSVLEDEGVAVVPLTGPFDPTHHEAISSEPHESIPAGHIIETLRAGYQYKGRVLRPAMVRVAG